VPVVLMAVDAVVADVPGCFALHPATQTAAAASPPDPDQTDAKTAASRTAFHRGCTHRHRGWSMPR
jgi:hypothetical protein